MFTMVNGLGVPGRFHQKMQLIFHTDIQENKNRSCYDQNTTAPKTKHHTPPTPLNLPNTDTDCTMSSLSVSSWNLTENLSLTWPALMLGKNDATAHIIILITAEYFCSAAGGISSSQKWMCCLTRGILFTQRLKKGFSRLILHGIKSK